MAKIKTFTCGQRKEFNIRVLYNILGMELKKLYRLRQQHEREYSQFSKDTIMDQALYCDHLCQCVSRSLSEFRANHQSDYVFD